MQKAFARFALPLLLLVGLAGVGIAAAYAEPDNFGGPLIREAAFDPGGVVILHANVGDVRVTPTEQGGKLRLVITPHNAADAAAAPGWVREFAANGSQAKIVLSLPDHGNHNFEIVLYVPAQSDLKLHLDVGDLRIEGVTGNTEAELGVGDLRMTVVDPHVYRSVALSVHIGDVDAKAFGLEPSGFLGKSVEKQFNNGTYRLHLHTGVGDVSCVAASKP